MSEQSTDPPQQSVHEATMSGRELILKLKDCAKKLIPLAQQDATGVLQQDNSDVLKLCEIIERIFLYGIKIKEFRNNIPLWGYLERMEMQKPPCLPLRNSAGAVASVETLRTPLAKARAWIRQVLNIGGIDESAMFMIAQSALLRAFYYPHAVLMNREESTSFVAILRSLKALKFNISIDGSGTGAELLNETPDWVHQQVRDASAVIIRNKKQSKNQDSNDNSNSNTKSSLSSGVDSSSNTTGGATSPDVGSGGMTSFLKSFELGLDKMLETVDLAKDTAAKFLNDQLEASKSNIGAGEEGGANFSSSPNTSGKSHSSVGSSLSGSVPLAGGGNTTGVPYLGNMAPFSTPNSSSAPINNAHRSTTAGSSSGTGSRDGVTATTAAAAAAAGGTTSSTTGHTAYSNSSSSSNNSSSPHHHKRPLTPFFGSSLKMLVLDDRRTASAYMDPMLGIPNMALCMIDFIRHHAKSKDLFRLSASVTALEGLQLSIEAEEGIPPETEVSTVTVLLIQWLNQLPEPLVGFQHYYAILACQEMEKIPDRVRNLALLMQECSWYAKPLLINLLTLFAHVVQPSLTIHNGLNLIAMAVISTPFLLRPYDPSMEPGVMLMAATAAGSATVEFLIAQFELVFQPVKEDLARRQTRLNRKCHFIHTLQSQIAETIDVDYLEYIDEERQALIRQLWDLLKLAENKILITAHTSPATPILSVHSGHDSGKQGNFFSSGDYWHKKYLQSRQSTIPEIIAHSRWHYCGFTDSAHSPSGSAKKNRLLADNHETNNNTSADFFNSSSSKSSIGETVEDERRRRGGGGRINGSMDEFDEGEDEEDNIGFEDKLSALPSVGAKELDTVLDDFNADFGYLAFKSLVGFLQKFTQEGTSMIVDFVLSRSRKVFSTFPQLVLRLTLFTAELLKLVPASDASIALRRHAKSYGANSSNSSIGKSRNGVGNSSSSSSSAGAGTGKSALSSMAYLGAMGDVAPMTRRASTGTVGMNTPPSPAPAPAPAVLTAAPPTATTLTPLKATGTSTPPVPGMLGDLNRSHSTVVVGSHSSSGQGANKNGSILAHTVASTSSDSTTTVGNSSIVPAGLAGGGGGGGGEGFSSTTGLFMEDAITSPQVSPLATGSHQYVLTPIPELARQPAWLLFNDESTFQEVFNLCILTFEDSWRACTTLVGAAPEAQTFAQCLGRTYSTVYDVVHRKRPKTVEQMWQSWVQERVALQQKSAEEKLLRSGSNTNTSQSASKQKDKKPFSRIQDNNTAGTETKSTVVTNKVTAGDKAPSSTPITERKGNTNSLSGIPDTKLSTPLNSAKMSGSSLKADYHGSNTTSTITNVEKAKPASTLPETHADVPATVANRGIASGNHNSNNNNNKSNNDNNNAQQIVKAVGGVTSNVTGGSDILDTSMIQQIESALPQTYQCYDWKRVYSLNVDGANVSTLVHNVNGHSNILLVVKDAGGSVFGALIPETLKIVDQEKYYGNGNIAVWSFNTGEFKLYNWSYKNSYYLLCSKDSLALGGGGNFALYLDGDLNHGSSGPCDTYSSPCLASTDTFTCTHCEVFALTSCLGI